VNILVLTSRGFERDLAPIVGFLRAAGHHVSLSVEATPVNGLGGVDLIVCHHHGKILPAAVIDAVAGWAVNLHPSLLPHCRGLHPILWSLATRAPLGVSLHFIEPTIDTGPIIAQRPVALDLERETVRSCYHALQAAAVALLLEAWPTQADWRRLAVPQPAGGTYFSKRDYARLKAAITTWDMPVAEFIRRAAAGP
jgi:methionyl-tRNA formyltransferase